MHYPELLSSLKYYKIICHYKVTNRDKIKAFYICWTLTCDLDLKRLPKSQSSTCLLIELVEFHKREVFSSAVANVLKVFFCFLPDGGYFLQCGITLLLFKIENQHYFEKNSRICPTEKLITSHN